MRFLDVKKGGTYSNHCALTGLNRILAVLELLTEQYRYISKQNLDPVVHEKNYDQITTMVEEQ
jgi:hypothetical protein